METPYSSLDELLPVLTEVLKPYLDRPFAFFGHSMGALIAFELARLLRRSGARGSEALFVSGHQSPPRPNKLPPIHHLEREEFIAGLRRFKFTPEPVLQNAELLELLLPALRADFSLYERYEFRKEPPLACPIVALGALHDELVDQEDLEAWEEHTEAPFSAHLFPGDHFYLYSAQESVLQTVSEELMLRLAEVDA